LSSCSKENDNGGKKSNDEGKKEQKYRTGRKKVMGIFGFEAEVEYLGAKDNEGHFSGGAMNGFFYWCGSKKSCKLLYVQLFKTMVGRYRIGIISRGKECPGGYRQFDVQS
jgi:hypothetical protein